jgi:thioredoxin 1
MLKQVNDNNFEQEVIQSAKPILVHFKQTWSGFSKRLSSEVVKCSAEFSQLVNFYELDTDDSSATASKYSISEGATAILLFKEGKVVWKKEGVQMSSTISDLIRRSL